MENGVESLHPHEVLELLLSIAVPRVDTKPAAWALLDRFGSFAGVLDASPEDLQEIAGVGPAGASSVKIVKGVATAYLKEKMTACDAVSSPEDVVRFCRMAWAGDSNEAVHALLTDTRNRVRRIECLTEGTVDKSGAYPRRLVEAAIHARATGVILVHNHPGGSVEPSPEDERFTKDARQALETVDIRLLDHIIVGREGWLSFRESGRLS